MYYYYYSKLFSIIQGKKGEKKIEFISLCCTNTFYIADFFNDRVMSYSLSSLISRVMAG